MSNEEMYQKVAEVFAGRVNALFESEQTLEAEFKRMYASLPFDRTEHWAGIIYNVLRVAWLEEGPIVKCDPTGMDKLQVLKAAAPLLDYNLFTQVLLNLQGYTGMHYMTGDAKNEIDRLKREWDEAKRTKGWKLDPFAKQAKMVKIAEIISDEQRQYNATISTLRALRIIEQFTPQISFRVSPKGSTPAFADSRNISMIGMGGDKYLKTMPTLRTYYITWDQVPKMAVHAINILEPGKVGVQGMVFEAPGIPYSFVSKSGGDILQEVLFARKIMYEIFKGHDITTETCIMIPRMNSLLVVADVEAKNLKNTFRELKERWPTLNLVEGQRA
jgi:hypothetical protein